MTSEGFKSARKKVFATHKHTIVKSALMGYERRGRGLVSIELTDTGEMRHLSYLTLDTLKHRQDAAYLKGWDHTAKLIEKASKYYPGSEILVLVTDGKYERVSVGSRQAMK
jgi:hypothetical protein